MEGQSGLSELSIISWLSAIQGCLLSRVPMYTKMRGGGQGSNMVQYLGGVLSLGNIDFKLH